MRSGPFRLFDFISSTFRFFLLRFGFIFFYFRMGCGSFTARQRVNALIIQLTSTHLLRQQIPIRSVLLFVPFIDWEYKKMAIDGLDWWSALNIGRNGISIDYIADWLTTCSNDNSTFIYVVPWLRYCLLIARNGMQLIRKWFQVLNYLRPYLLLLLLYRY